MYCSALKVAEELQFHDERSTERTGGFGKRSDFYGLRSLKVGLRIVVRESIA